MPTINTPKNSQDDTLFHCVRSGKIVIWIINSWHGVLVIGKWLL